ncbi:DNA damage-regulated autophagy modulator protein 2 [Chelonus insularis]|uniref:DNA damage-regulated autophagy modulator protein 2 n=1 Tax=Chelonus insularis TaxID=460826 RepID=UPI00158DF18B|nr:DNA damage-regulated autophagy modulator protein 2 [Chelonus insularis]
MEKQDVISDLHYLPIIMFVSLPSIIVITYIIAVVNGHVEPGFPYISDAAAFPPESCIFAQFLNLIAVLMCIIIYIRYAQVKEVSNTYQLSAFWQRLNNISLIIGIISTLGMSITGNFQETSNLVVHLIGATLCFGGGTVYIWLQAIYSYRLNPIGCSPRLTHLRLGLSAFCTVCFFVVFIGAALAAKDYNGSDPKTWSKNDGGWEMHLLSTITEWLCACTICVYILSFTNEFREVQLSYPKISYKADYTRKIYGVFEATPDSISPTRSI